MIAINQCIKAEQFDPGNIISYPALQCNKIFILLRSSGFLFGQLYQLPSEPLRRPLAPFGGFGIVLGRNKIMVLCRLARCFHLPSSLSYTLRAALSSLFASGAAPAPSALGMQPLVCHRIDQCDLHAAVIESPPYSVDVPVSL